MKKFCKWAQIFSTDLFVANFCLSTSPSYGVLEMLFEEELHIHGSIRLCKENTSFIECYSMFKKNFISTKCIIDDTEVIGQGRMAKIILICAQDKLCMRMKTFWNFILNIHYVSINKPITKHTQTQKFPFKSFKYLASSTPLYTDNWNSKPFLFQSSELFFIVSNLSC